MRPGEAPAVFAEALAGGADRRRRARVGRDSPTPPTRRPSSRAIEAAVADVRGGRAAALVTNPIHKDSLYRAGFRHPGHTEYLAELAGSGRHPGHDAGLPGLRVVPVTDPSGAAPGGRQP